MGRNLQITAYKMNNMLVDIIFQHKGEQNIISSKEIAAILNENGYKINVNTIHTVIRKVMFERRLPICSVNSKGYFWGVTRREIQSTIDDLRGRIEEMQERINLLKNFIID